MMIIEDFKKDRKNFPKEIQANTGKQLEALKEETQISLEELQENTTKHMMELNKTIQDLKMEIETTKKSQRETTLEIESLGKRSGQMQASPTEYKRQKRESQRKKIAQKTLTQQSKKMQNAKSS